MLRHILTYLQFHLPLQTHLPSGGSLSGPQALQGAKRPLRERVASCARKRASFYDHPSLTSGRKSAGVLHAVGIHADSDGVLFFYLQPDGDLCK